MGKIATGAAIAVGALGTVVIAAAQTGPEDAETNIAGWLKRFGIDQIPDVLTSGQADVWATIVGLLIVVASGAAWWCWRWWKRGHQIPDFDDVGAWSISVDLGHMASSHEGTKMTRYIRDMCRFVNLSTTQARIVEVTVTIPYLDRKKTPVTLSATRRLPIDDVRIGPVLPARFDPFLSFPIRIEPNAVVEGRIEFEIQEGGVDSDDLDLFCAHATIKESRSHKSQKLRDGEVYDASKQRAYRGRIGEPHAVWRPKLRRLWQRLKGQRPLRMRTPGEMAEEGACRMTEIERLLAAEGIARPDGGAEATNFPQGAESGHPNP